MIDVSPPKNSSEEFLYYWNILLPDLVHRPNLKPGHLLQLKILCDQYVEYDKLKDIIEATGRTYEVVGRNGVQIKLYPEVTQQTKVVGMIKDYSKALKLVLMADTKLSNVEEEENEFDD